MAGASRGLGGAMKRLWIVLFLAGCATQNYGRLPPVGAEEAALLTCPQIEIELAKSRAYMTEIQQEHDRFTASDVTGFLGDFGIGNSIEYSNASEAGHKRLDALTQLQYSKHCFTAAGSAAPTASPSQ